jgi:flagellar L-ring protein precursor FlgH
LDQFAAQQGLERQTLQPGSLWTPTALFSDLSADLRARRVGDVVTILVQEKASAVSSGTVKTQRNSSLQASISAAGGITRPTGPLVNLAKAGTNSALDGQGATTRDTTLTASISTVVTQVLPNGSLVIQGTKNVKINSENQVLGLRGIVRPVDLSAANMVSSDRVAQMDLQVNGKGVVADSVKRPFILYRLLMDILP